MKERMITVVFGVTLLIIVLLFYTTIALNVALAAVTVLSVYEVFGATKNTSYTGLMAICFAFAAVVPFVNFFRLNNAVVIVFFVFSLAIFSYMLLKHKTIKLSQMSLCYMMTLLVTSSMSCMLYLRDEYANSGRLLNAGLIYVALVFIGAWATDIGGYIFGRLFGRHKLSPSVSPKKTVEGAAGGILLAVLTSVGLLWGYSAYLSYNGVQAKYYFVSVIFLSLLCAIVSIVGDLSASLIKRENSVKDFGKILPGHGGILDRFDSIIFVAPLVLVWVGIFPIMSL